ncbi:hypothetical protein A2642_00560 [Candidatus Nomurabacteria bacterium RIFCSPHIGHO2_01_FULL_39_10]|uniref:Uncharacterized protein n=1 Tax=Candidatus Nomurabacteria bacterium RIFCSPHIGHO2_01_FULL_39_10 TaxID=1801733 RepID=A0A1F6V312_9BACT|nr:MAG: hypothetical protein A2642_00560 [Candidatus Nomurabacteria bacterium RIFCSPHIGHO2_01_FULL_39_10]
MSKEIPSPERVRLYATTGMNFITDGEHNIFYPLRYGPAGHPVTGRPHFFETKTSPANMLPGENYDILPYHLCQINPEPKGDIWINRWGEVNTKVYPVGTPVGPQPHPEVTDMYSFHEEKDGQLLNDTLRILYVTELSGDKKTEFIKQLEEQWGVFRPKENSPRWEAYQQAISQYKINNLPSREHYLQSEQNISTSKINKHNVDAYLDAFAEHQYLDEIQRMKPQFNFLNLYFRMFPQK